MTLLTCGHCGFTYDSFFEHSCRPRRLGTSTTTDCPSCAGLRDLLTDAETERDMARAEVERLLALRTVDAVLRQDPDATFASNEIVALRAENARLVDLLRWVAAIKPGPCRYDHHDYCQEHNLDERPCPMEAIYDLTADPTPEGPSR